MRRPYQGREWREKVFLAGRRLDGGDCLVEVTEVAILLMGVVLGWLLMFAVRRYQVHWGAFATFLSVILGSAFLEFLFTTSLLPWYGIGLFLGFFGNLAVRAAGTIVGGRVGEGLLEISAFSTEERANGAGDGPEGEGPA